MRVLVVEDKVKLATILGRGLRKEGLSADICTTGETLRSCASELLRAGAASVAAVTVAKTV